MSTKDPTATHAPTAGHETDERLAPVVIVPSKTPVGRLAKEAVHVPPDRVSISPSSLLVEVTKRPTAAQNPAVAHDTAVRPATWSIPPDVG